DRVCGSHRRSNERNRFSEGVHCSYSTGGTSPSDSCRRALLNQPMYSTTASSSWERLRQTRSAISSVLKLSTNDSASALSYASPTLPTEASRRWSASVCV